IQVLKNVEPDDIVFLNHDDRNTLIPPGTLLQPLADNTTDTKPLVVRYPISDSSIKELFDSLSTAKIIFIVTKNSNGQCNLEEKIEDEYSFMNLLTRTRPNESNERILDLKIQIKGRKAFGDWTLKEVGNEIYKNNFNSIDSMQKLNLEEFPELEPSFSSEEIEYFIQQLKDKAFAFNNKISTNKATVREYISIFMTIVVKHIRKYKDSTTELHVESELDGSRGYGNLDYEVIIQDVPVLINEAKKHDMEKGVAQNLVQVYTAAETLLGKRKREQVDSLPSMMFGIVTMGHVWRFIRWSGTLQDPRAEITPEIALAQADILKNGNNRDEERDE
ncbi:18453_t:CDS:2, partial [Gigaspora margarita]